MEDGPCFTIEEFQTRDYDNQVIQHPTFDDAYALFKPSCDYFKISYDDTEGNDHRWVWMKEDQVWSDKPICIATEYDGDKPYFVKTSDEIERLTNEEFSAKHH